jgi:hypothetical protein
VFICLCETLSGSQVGQHEEGGHHLGLLHQVNLQNLLHFGLYKYERYPYLHARSQQLLPLELLYNVNGDRSKSLHN